MSEPIKTKRCSKCKTIKPISEFHIRRNRKSGLMSSCKYCERIRVVKWQQSPRGKQRRCLIDLKFHQSEKGKIARREYVARNREKTNAVRIVRSAVEKGLLPKVSEQKCSYCDNQAKHYHHPRGYDSTHHLDVIQLCVACHNHSHTALATTAIMTS